MMVVARAAAESAQENIVWTQRLVQKSSEVSKGCARQLVTARLALVNQTGRIFRADAKDFDHRSFADVRVVENRESNHVVIVVVLIIIPETLACGSLRGTFACDRTFS